MKPELSTKEKKIGSAHFTRRNLLKGAGLTALTGMAVCNVGSITSSAMSSSKGSYRIPIPQFSSIGVEPLINCWGTMTTLSGSLMLPEIKAAVMDATTGYVSMGELFEGVSKRLGELTSCEWGFVTCGASAAIFAATAGCITEGDRRKKAKLPDTSGMKNVVVTPKEHNTGYLISTCKCLGAELVVVETTREFRQAVDGKTAMIHVLGEHYDRGEISYEDIIAVGRGKGVPIFVDAAAERPDVPNVYLESGSDIVCYSGGKCMRGPQSSGLLLGRKDLCKWAEMNVSPSGGIGRPMKVGKEEIMGVLAAYDLWLNGRDHEAEFKEWEGWLKHIDGVISSIDGITTKIVQPYMRSNVAPTLSIKWDENRIKLTLREVHQQLWNGSPRIAIATANNHESRRAAIEGKSVPKRGVTVMPFMMCEGEEVIAAKRLKEIFTSAS
ncbi:MAG: hypothetical protein HOC71_02775 [Candidatus Latescibacteria bacterium]|nr:hypothetical protein [Candidatus Latescibacterota bacterium]